MDVNRLSQLISAPPDFPARTLLLWATGSVNAAMLPYWLNWLRQMYPDLRTSVILTPSAERFVSVLALKSLVTGEVWRDSWDDPVMPSSYVVLEEAAECFAVFPATLNSTMALASGAAYSPALMCLQVTKKPIAVAASFPGTNEVIERQLELLLSRPNVVLSEQVSAFSVGKAEWGGQTGAFMPLLIETLAAQISKAAAGPTAAGSA